MQLRRYRLSNTVSATGVADSMQFPRSGKIKQIIINQGFNAVTDNAQCTVSVTKASTNDAYTSAGGGVALTQTIAENTIYSNFVTSGLAQPNGTTIFECNDAYSLGDILYLQALVVGTVSNTVGVIVVCEEN